MLYASHILELKTRNKHNYFIFCYNIYQSQWKMTDFFSFSFHFHRNSSWIILLFQRLLWTSTSDTSIMKRYLTFFCIFFFFFNISIRGNPIKMCCFEVLKINRRSGVTQIVRSLWKRRGENCFCLTLMTFLWYFSSWIAN